VTHARGFTSHISGNAIFLASQYVDSPMSAMLDNPNSTPRNGSTLIKAEAEVIPMSEDRTTEPQTEQPTPKVPITSPNPLALAAPFATMRLLK